MLHSSVSADKAPARSVECEAIIRVRDPSQLLSRWNIVLFLDPYFNEAEGTIVVLAFGKCSSNASVALLHPTL